MKLLIVTSSYPMYLRAFYATRPGLSVRPYEEQKRAYEQDAFGWSSCWRDPLRPRGCEVSDIVWNAEPMQRAWARENGHFDAERLQLKQIALLQAQELKPDLLWFDDYDREFLTTLRQRVPSIRRVLGWVGSAIPQTDIWQEVDLILSCAPETVGHFRQMGGAAACFPHSFDPRIIGRLKSRAKSVEFSFVGQLLRFSDFHLKRDMLLEKLAAEVPLQIHSPAACVTRGDQARALVKVAACRGMRLLQRVGVPQSLLREVPVLGIVAGLSPDQCLPVNPRLKPFLKPALYGEEMYQLVADSLSTLNIHADSSPLFASNMRLYEVTGVGTCLVTDYKKNLQELFVPDCEVVSFSSAAECVEKVKWLLDHREAALEIARAGQRRTLDNYTFSHRAEALARILARLASGAPVRATDDEGWNAS